MKNYYNLVKVKIESKRNSENLFWKMLTAVKDFFWLLEQYLKKILLFIIFGSKAQILDKSSFKFRFFKFLTNNTNLFEFSQRDVCIILPGFSLKFILGQYDAVMGYFSEYLPKNGDVVIDGGAYFGLDTVILSLLVGPFGKVISFEPDLQNFNVLKKNIENIYKLKNVILINKGLCNQNTELNLFDNRSTWPDGMAASYYPLKKSDKSVKVQAVKLDDELEKLAIKKVDFIKMDIEGAEIDTVLGAEKILRNNNVNLAIASYHLLDGQKTYITLEKIFKDLGYKSKTGNKIHLTTWAWKNN